LHREYRVQIKGQEGSGVRRHPSHANLATKNLNIASQSLILARLRLRIARPRLRVVDE